jgi:type IV pilus assembly protein PilC
MMAAHYYWEGVNRLGKKTSGSEKISRKQLEKKLVAHGITILKIRLHFRNPHPRISQKSASNFTLQFSTLLNSGIAIQQALHILVNSSENKAIRFLAGSISNKISQGISLSDACKSFPHYFNPMYCNMIYLGEQSGTLLDILQELIRMQSQLNHVRSQFLKAISYPLFILLSTFFITSSLLIFVMPKFQSIFEQANIPLPSLTQTFITLSESVRRLWPLLLTGILALPFSLFIIWKNNSAHAIRIEKILLKIPLIGPLIKSNQSARFASLLATSLHAGLPLTKALEMSAPTATLKLYQSGILRTLAAIKNGRSLASALKNSAFLSSSTQELIAIGETAGRLDDMLFKAAALEQQALQNSIDVLSKWLEPVMMIILGIIVGFVIIAMYLPVFQMNAGI